MMQSKLEYPLPKLRATNEQLYELYHGRVHVDTKDIKSTFDVSPQTAIKVIKKVKEYIVAHDENYIPPVVNRVPVKWLFELYGWDIKQINSSVKVMQKGVHHV